MFWILYNGALAFPVVGDAQEYFFSYVQAFYYKHAVAHVPINSRSIIVDEMFPAHLFSKVSGLFDGVNVVNAVL
jgi:hypothetical protein